VFVLAFYLSGEEGLRDRLGVETEDVPEFASLGIDSFVETCVKSTTEDSVLLLGFQGGYDWIPEDKRTYAGTLSDIPYWFYEGVPEQPGRDVIRGEIEAYVDEYIDDCINEVNVEGYELTLGEPSTTVMLNKDSLVVKLNYPMSIRQGEFVKSKSKYRVELPIRLAKVIAESEGIVKMLSEFPGAMDVSYLSSLELENTIFDMEDGTKIFKIRDDESRIASEPYQFVFATMIQKTYKNRAPVMETVEDIFASVGEDIVFVVHADDPDGDPIRYSAMTTLFEIEEGSGLVAFTAEFPGVYYINVEAEDPFYANSYSIFMINITEGEA